MNGLDSVKRDTKRVCGAHLISSKCDAIRGSRSGTGLSFLLNCGSKLMRFFSAIGKLASFQVICSNVNPDTTADVEKKSGG